MSSLGREFEILIGPEGRIVDVVGDWPADGKEFQLPHPPAHMSLLERPERLAADPRSAGRTICWYDQASSRACFCDDTGRVLHCVGTA